MKTYGDGSNVEVTIPFYTERSDVFVPNTLSYRVLDSSGTVLVAPAAIIYGGEQEAVVTVASINNTLGADETRLMRVVELTAVTDEGIVTVESRYIIESITYIGVGENSFQTYNDALLIELDLIGVDSWSASPIHKQKAAMIEAYTNITRLSFKLQGSQDKLFAGSRDVAIRDLSASELASLDGDMMLAIRKAQVVEADVILGGDPVADKRKSGLMSETIGESSNMFRPGKPLVMPVSDRALRYLAPFIALRKVIG